MRKNIKGGQAHGPSLLRIIYAVGLVHILLDTWYTYYVYCYNLVRACVLAQLHAQLPQAALSCMSQRSRGHYKTWNGPRTTDQHL